MPQSGDPPQIRVRVLEVFASSLIHKEPDGTTDTTTTTITPPEVYCKIFYRAAIKESKRSAYGTRGDTPGTVKFEEWVCFDHPTTTTTSTIELKAQLFLSGEVGECVGQTEWVRFATESSYGFYHCAVSHAGGEVGSASVEVKYTSEHQALLPCEAFGYVSLPPDVVIGFLNGAIRVTSLLCWVSPFDSAVLFAVLVLMLGCGDDGIAIGVTTGVIVSCCATLPYAPFIGQNSVRKQAKRSRHGEYLRDEGGFVSQLVALRDLTCSAQHNAQAMLHIVFSIGWWHMNAYNTIINAEPKHKAIFLCFCGSIWWLQMVYSVPLIPLVLVSAMIITPFCLSWRLLKIRLPFLPEATNFTPAFLTPKDGVASLRLVSPVIASYASGLAPRNTQPPLSPATFSPIFPDSLRSSTPSESSISYKAMRSSVLNKTVSSEDRIEKSGVYTAVVCSYPEGKGFAASLEALNEKKRLGLREGRVAKHDIVMHACTLLHALGSQMREGGAARIMRLLLASEEAISVLSQENSFQVDTSSTQYPTAEYLPLQDGSLSLSGSDSARRFVEDVSSLVMCCPYLLPLKKGEKGGRKELLCCLSHIAAALFAPQVGIVCRKGVQEIVFVVRVLPQCDEGKCLAYPDGYHPRFNSALTPAPLLRQLHLCASKLETTLQALLEQLSNAKYVYYRSDEVWWGF